MDLAASILVTADSTIRLDGPGADFDDDNNRRHYRHREGRSTVPNETEIDQCHLPAVAGDYENRVVLAVLLLAVLVLLVRMIAVALVMIATWFRETSSSRRLVRRNRWSWYRDNVDDDVARF